MKRSDAMTEGAGFVGKQGDAGSTDAGPVSSGMSWAPSDDDRCGTTLADESDALGGERSGAAAGHRPDRASGDCGPVRIRRCDTPKRAVEVGKSVDDGFRSHLAMSLSADPRVSEFAAGVYAMPAARIAECLSDPRRNGSKEVRAAVDIECLVDLGVIPPGAAQRARELNASDAHAIAMALQGMGLPPRANKI